MISIKETPWYFDTERVYKSQIMIDIAKQLGFEIVEISVITTPEDLDNLSYPNKKESS